MITEKEFLKSYRIMGEEEKKDYLARVERWTEETFPHLLALAESWEKVPVKDFDEGLRLASALRNARAFIAVAQRYEAARAIRKLNAYLAEVREKSGLSKKAVRKASDKTRYRAVVPEKGVPQEDGTLVRREYVPEEVDRRRPEHLAQYIGILPPELQRRCAAFPDMYLALAEYRGRLEVLSEHPDADREAVAEFARKSVRQEQEIRSLWAEVDAAVAAAYGEESPEEQQDYTQDMKRPGDCTKEEIDAMEDLQRQDFCRKQRIDANKRYVRRKDVKMTDEYRRQLRLRIRELMEWGESVPEKAHEMCAAAGVVISGFNDREEKA